MEASLKVTLEVEMRKMGICMARVVGNRARKDGMPVSGGKPNSHAPH